MIGFHKNTVVDVHDIDFNGVCRTSALLKYIQAAAESQLVEAGLSYDTLKERGLAFVLSKLRIDIDEPVYAYDKLDAMTVPCQSRGYSFLRYYEIRRCDKVIAKCASVWALINIDSRKLVRVEDFNLPLELKESSSPINHITMPEGFIKAGVYLPSYHDLDRNRHVNNTRYADIFCNFLPMEKKRISSLTVNFINEAKQNEPLEVFLAESDGEYFIKTVGYDSKINTYAKIKLTDL